MTPAKSFSILLLLAVAVNAQLVGNMQLEPRQVYLGEASTLTVEITNLGPTITDITLFLNSTSLELAQSFTIAEIERNAKFTKQVTVQTLDRMSLGNHTIDASLKHGSASEAIPSIVLPVEAFPITLNATLSNTVIEEGVENSISITVENTAGKDFKTASITLSYPSSFEPVGDSSLTITPFTQGQKVSKEFRFKLKQANQGRLTIIANAQFVDDAGTHKLSRFVEINSGGTGIGGFEMMLVAILIVFAALLLLKRMR